MIPRRAIMLALETALRTVPDVDVEVDPVDDIDADKRPVLALTDGGESPGPAPDNASRSGKLPRMRVLAPTIEMHARGHDARDTLDRLYEQVVATVLGDDALRQTVAHLGGGIDIGDYELGGGPGETLQGVAVLTLEISYVLKPTNLTR